MHLVHDGSCLDPRTGLPALGDDSADAAILDPPYSRHVHEVGLVRGFQNRRPSEKFGFEALDAETMHGVARELARIVKRWVLVFSDVESVGLWIDALTRAGLEYIRTGAWVKTRAAPQRTGDRPAAGFEAIVIAHRPGPKRWNRGGGAGVWSYPVCVPPERVHPTQKPLALMDALVDDFTDRGELVVDPFCGAGTTGVACRRKGRRFIGWEENPAFAEIARRRIAGTSEQLDLLRAAFPISQSEPASLELPLDHAVEVSNGRTRTSYTCPKL